MKRLGGLLVLIVVLLGAFAGSTQAQGDGLTLEATLGLGGYCRPDVWCPLRVVIDNRGADVEGVLRVSPRSSLAPSGGYDRYTMSVLLPAGSRKAFPLYVPMTPTSTNLEIELVAGGRVIAADVVEARLVGEKDRLYGVVSGERSILRYLSDVLPAGAEANVAQLTLDALPADPLGWELLDAVVLNDVDTTALTEDQRRALETWVVHGGSLVIGGGAGGARTVSGLGDIAPVAVTGLHSVADLSGLERALGIELDQPLSGGYAIAQVELLAGDVLLAQGDMPLVVRAERGAGWVEFLAFDAGLTPSARWEDNVALWQRLLSVEAVKQTTNFPFRDRYQAAEAVGSIPGLAAPSVLQILGFSLIYTVLIGPINYLVLRSLDRRQWAWITIPVTVVIFTFLAYLTGFQLRGREAIIHQLSVVYVPAGADSGRINQAVGLFSPRRMRYDVRVEAAGVEALRENGGMPGSEDLTVEVLDGGLAIQDLQVDIGGIEPFAVHAYTSTQGLTTGLRFSTVMSQVAGTIRNGPIALEDAVLLSGSGGVEQLGDLEPGQEREVQLGSGSPPSFNPDLSMEIMGGTSYYGDRELYRRYQLLHSIFPYRDANLVNGVYLLGWSADQKLVPIEVVDGPYSNVGTTLYIYGVPIEPPALRSGETVTIPSSFIAREVEQGDAQWGGVIHLPGFGSEVILRFSVWPELALETVDRAMLEFSGSTGTLPMVSVWNWQQESWDDMEVDGNQVVISDGEAYALSPGIVRVKLEAASDMGGRLGSITLTMEGRR